MTAAQRQQEILARKSTDDAGGANVSYSIELGRSRHGLHLVATRKSKWCPPFPDSFTRVIEAPTASELEFDLERLCFELADGSQDGLDAADALTRLFAQVMRDVSERFRIANQTAKTSEGAPTFDVGVFRWGERDHEFACRLVDPRPKSEDPLDAFDRVFSRPTLDEAFDALRQYWRPLVAASGDDEAKRALLEECWRACERAMAEARLSTADGRTRRSSA